MNRACLHLIFSSGNKRNSFLGFFFLLAIALSALVEAPQAKYLQVRTDRYLEVQQMTGRVTYEQGRNSRIARLGTRLQGVGEALRTGFQSSAVLAVDTNIGFVNISENTHVRVRELRLRPDGGRITRLEVTSGQADLQVRPFTNDDSQLEIHTPAGVSAVRGTQFGVVVHPDGKTGVATSEGSVVTKSQGKEVVVNAGFEVLLIPGEPPPAVTPLREESGLKLQLLTAVENQMARIVGQVAPSNLVIVAERPLVTNNGQFDVTVPLPPDRQIKAVVKTPLGKKQVYELAVP